MDLYEELVLKNLESILEACKCEDEDDSEEDDEDDSEDDDDLKESDDSDDDDDDDSEDDEDDSEEDDEDLKEAFDFTKIKVGSKFIKPSESQIEALENLFSDISQSERKDLWKELTKDEASFRRIAKYAETIS